MRLVNTLSDGSRKYRNFWGAEMLVSPDGWIYEASDWLGVIRDPRIERKTFNYTGKPAGEYVRYRLPARLAPRLSDERDAAGATAARRFYEYPESV